jgi:hypothetical protein
MRARVPEAKGELAETRDYAGKHITIRRSHRYPLPQGGRGSELAGHSFRTGRPCSQPSRTHPPRRALWQPGPQPSAAMAGAVIANMIKQNPRRAERRIIVEAPIDLRDQPGNSASGSLDTQCDKRVNAAGPSLKRNLPAWIRRPKVQRSSRMLHKFQFNGVDGIANVHRPPIHSAFNSHGAFPRVEHLGKSRFRIFRGLGLSSRFICATGRLGADAKWANHDNRSRRAPEMLPR